MGGNRSGKPSKKIPRFGNKGEGAAEGEAGRGGGSREGRGGREGRGKQRGEGEHEAEEHAARQAWREGGLDMAGLRDEQSSKAAGENFCFDGCRGVSDR